MPSAVQPHPLDQHHVGRQLLQRLVGLGQIACDLLDVAALERNLLDQNVVRHVLGKRHHQLLAGLGLPPTLANDFEESVDVLLIEIHLGVVDVQPFAALRFDVLVEVGLHQLLQLVLPHREVVGLDLLVELLRVDPDLGAVDHRERAERLRS